MERYSWTLRIAGVGVRFYRGDAPAPRAIEGQAAGGHLVYTDRPAVQSIGDQSQSLDPIGGIGEAGNTNVVLAAGGDTITDPARVFRLDRPAPAVRLATTIAAEDGIGVMARVDTLTSPAGWPVDADGRYHIHIGQEWMIATGLDVAGPTYGFTGVTRCVGETFRRLHMVDPDRGLYPAIASAPFAWRGRRAHLTYRAPGGVEVEYASGFLAGPPELAQDGQILSVSIASLLSILDMTLGSRSSTRLLQGWHEFEAGVGDTIRRVDFAPAGSIYRDEANLGEALGAGSIRVKKAGRLALVADFSAPLDNGIHPRIIAFESDAWSPGVTVAGESAGPQLDLDAGVTIPAGLNANDVLVNETSWSLQEATVPPGLQVWPAAGVNALNTAWGHVGSAGGPPSPIKAWVDMTVIQRDDEAWELRYRLTSDLNIEGVRSNFRFNWSGGGPEWYGNPPPQTSTTLWYGCQLFPPDAIWYDGRSRGDGYSDPPARSQGGHASTQYWLDGVFPDWSKEVAGLEIRGFAKAFYQTGEASFICEDDIFGGNVPSFATVQIKWREGSDDRRAYCRIDSVTEVLHPVSGLHLGWRYVIAGDPMHLRSFGDWGSDRATISACVVAKRATTADLLLELLYSAGGGVSGFDRLPVGLGLTDREVDTAEIQSANDGADMLWTLVETDAFKVRDLVEPMLRAQGLILRQVGNPLRLGLCRVGAPGLPVGSISDPQIGAEYAVRTKTAYNTVCAVEIQCAWVDGEPQIKGTFVDESAKEEAGGNAGNPVKLELRGADVSSSSEAIARYLSLAQGIVYRLGQARRPWMVTVGWPTSLRIGDSVAVSLRGATKLDGSRGVSTTAQVIAIEQLPDRIHCVLTLQGYPGQGAGWAPGAIVVSAPAPDQLELPAGAGPHFVAGDLLWGFGPGDWAGRHALTVASVSGDVITTTAPHLLGAGDRIRVQPWSSVTPRVQQYAFADRGKTWI